MMKAPSGCWIWIGARQKSGHGKIGIDGRTMCAHRVAWETFVGPIPDGLHIDHLCRRPACINPLHLQPVTARVNWSRGTSQSARQNRRTHCVHGHAFADHSRIYGGKRKCMACSRQYARDRRARIAEESAA